MTWTRTINSTHGIIRAVIDFSDDKPNPTAVSAYQARTTDTLRYTRDEDNRIHIFFFFFLDAIFDKQNLIQLTVLVFLIQLFGRMSMFNSRLFLKSFLSVHPIVFYSL